MGGLLADMVSLVESMVEAKIMLCR